MSKLSPGAAALVSDIARSYGLRDLAPDADGLVRVEIDGRAIILAFSDAWDSVFLSSVLAWDAALPSRTLFRAFALRDRFQGRTTRLACEPKSGALVLIAEIGLKVHYGAFSAALAAFLTDARLAQDELSLDAVTG